MYSPHIYYMHIIVYCVALQSASTNLQTYIANTHYTYYSLQPIAECKFDESF